MFFAKFASRIGYVNDDAAQICFTKGLPEQMDEDTYGNFDKAKSYSLQMSSDHMSSRATNKPYRATYNNLSGEAQQPAIREYQIRDQYKVTLKKEVIVKFFKILHM